MGGNVSQLPPAPANFPFFCITFRIYDKMKIIDADQQTIGYIRQILQQAWPAGVQREQMENGVYEFKFSGSPFSRNTSKEEAIAIKRVCCALLSNLRQMGWELLVASDLSRTQDLTTWFFQRNPTLVSAGLSAPHICGVSLSSYDKIQIVNAPPYLHGVLKECVAPILQSESPVGSDYEFKLQGYPWNSADFYEGVNARRMILNIFRRFDQNRFKFTGTANLKGTADTIFFELDANMTPGETRYMMLSLNRNDRLRIIEAPQEVIDAVRDCLTKYWPNGLQDQKVYNDISCFEFKLKGYPWCTYGDEAAAARFLITIILQTLVSHGWAILTALDISRRLNDKAVFVLRSCAPASIPHFCISPNDIDKLKVMNAPKDVVELMSQLIRTYWPYGIQRENPIAVGYEWKVQGQPWHAYGGNDYAMSRHMMTMILNEMSQRGWRVICSADVSSKYHHSDNGPDYPLDVHTWFLAQTGIAAAAAASGPAPAQLGFEHFNAQPTAPSGGVDAPPSYNDVTKY